MGKSNIFVMRKGVRTPLGAVIESVHGVMDDANNPEATLLRIAHEWRHIPEERQALLDQVAKVVQVVDSAFSNSQSTIALLVGDLAPSVADVQKKALSLYLHYRDGRDHMEVLARLWDQARSRDPLGEDEPDLEKLSPEMLARLLKLQYAALVEGLTSIHALGESTVRFYLEMAGKAPLEYADQSLLMDMGHTFSNRVGVHLFLNLHAVMRVAMELARRSSAAADAPPIWSPPWQTDPRLGDQVPPLP